MNKFKKIISSLLALILILNFNTKINFAYNLYENSGTIVSADFENEQYSDWQPRGNSTISFDENAHTGNNSVKISNRINTSDGIGFDLTNKLEDGVTYKFNAWAYQNTFDSSTINISREEKPASNQYPSMGNFTLPKGQWVEINSEFTYSEANGKDLIILYLQTPWNNNIHEAKDLFDIYFDDASITSVSEVPTEIEDIPNIKEQFENKFTIGVAASTSVVLDRMKSELAKKHFNSITAENSMKPESVLDKTASQNAIDKMPKFNFDEADKMMDFAQANGIKVRGHVLVWHSQTPDWFFKEDYKDDGNLVSKEVMVARMESSIKSTLEHFQEKYPDVIYAWDVVNEAIDPSEKDGYRAYYEGTKKSLWREIIGTEFVEQAFVFARKYADENILLFYNDYSETDVVKRDLIINLILKPLKEKGLIDGMGMQGHYKMSSPTTKAFEEAINKYAETGVDVQITELDIQTEGEQTEENLIKEGFRYKELFDVINNNENKISNVTFWGLTDDGSWLNSDSFSGPGAYPLLFDKNLKAKYAYWGIIDYKKIPVMSKTANALNFTTNINEEIEDSFKIQDSNKIYDSEGNEIGNFKITWDKNNIYILTDTKNATYIEMLIDGNIVKLTKDNIVSSENIKDINSFTKENGTGFISKIQIPFTKTLEINNTINFDLYISQSSWNNTNFDGLVQSDNVCGKINLIKMTKYSNANYGSVDIDGTVDAIWDKAIAINVDVKSTESTSTAVVKTLWDENWIYILSDVTDNNLSKLNSNLYEQDSVEIFIDENNQKTEFYQDDDEQYRVNFDNLKSINTGVGLDTFVSATQKTETGYIVELKIPSRNGGFFDEECIGIDFQVNDDNGSGSRTGVANWNDLSGNGWYSTKGYGVLILDPVVEEIVAPEKTKLKIELEYANSLNLSLYTTSSLVKYKEAIVLGKVVFEKEDATEKEIKDAVNYLISTKANLIKITNSSSGSNSNSSSSSPISTIKNDDIASLDKDKTALENVAKDDFIISNNKNISISKSKEQSFISGYDDLTFRPTAPMALSELATILFNLSVNTDKNSVKTKTDNWYDKPMAFLELKELLPENSDPKKELTRGEVAILLAQFVDTKDLKINKKFIDIKGNESEEAINILFSKGILKGYADSTFKPNKKISRVEVVILINRLREIDTNNTEENNAKQQFSDIPKTHWAYNEIMTGVKK